jgi:hypothetical protein
VRAGCIQKKGEKKQGIVRVLVLQCTTVDGLVVLLGGAGGARVADPRESLEHLVDEEHGHGEEEDELPLVPRQGDHAEHLVEKGRVQDHAVREDRPAARE